MRLSPLQRYIMRVCYTKPGSVVGRSVFPKFYERQTKKPNADDLVNIITKSLESLIDKGFMVGYGVRTTRKWYIREVKLTPLGRRTARKLLGEQQALPFKLKRSS